MMHQGTSAGSDPPEAPAESEEPDERDEDDEDDERDDAPKIELPQIDTW
jgi:hypothetical protein